MIEIIAGIMLMAQIPAVFTSKYFQSAFAWCKDEKESDSKIKTFLQVVAYWLLATYPMYAAIIGISLFMS